MTRVRLTTCIEAPIEQVFDLARDLDLHQRSMAATRERAIGGRTSGRIGLGEHVTWQARHFGRTWTLTSRITELETPHRLVDEQVRGPFRSFRHVHVFTSFDDRRRTRMTDEWVHVSPLGQLGWLADRLVLDRYIRRLLETRNATIKREAESARTSEPGTRTAIQAMDDPVA